MTDKLAINGGNPIRKTFIPYGSQKLDSSDIEAVTKILKSDFITQGPKIEEFEEKVAKYCGAKYAVAVSSGTAALHCAAFAAGISKKDEAITSPITFAASGNCILFLGGVTKFADIKKDTYNINPEEIQKKITPKTKALIPVDFTGQPCDLDEIMEIAEDNDLIVVEDACHALGAEYKGKKIGGIADMSIFSFHPVKYITTGEGGMVLTDNEEFYERLKLFRTHGITKNPEMLKKNDGGWYYEMHHLGYNYRVTDIQCALGISQLVKLDGFVIRRRAIVRRYNEAFRDMEEIITPYEKTNVKAAYHLYMILLNLEKLSVNRKKIFDALRAENIGVHVHYIPLHIQPYYQEKLGYKEGDFPIAEDYYKRALTIPLFPKMSNDDVEDVIEGVEKVIMYYRS